MKFTVTMKDPDTLHDAINEAVAEEVREMPNLDAEEKADLAITRSEKYMELAGKWFEYGEYLRVEIDTEAKTITVLEAA